MSEESIRIVMTLTQFTSRFTIALGTLQNMLVNAEGGNQTENGVLPRPAIEEDEDEDDPDKLIGKLCFCGISLILKILLAPLTKEITSPTNYETGDFLCILKLSSNLVSEILIPTAKLPADIKPLLDICYLAQGCILLLHLKHHLKETYGFSDR